MKKTLQKSPKKILKLQNCIGVCVPFVYIAGAPLKVTASRPWRPAGKGSSGQRALWAGFVYQQYESAIKITSQLQLRLVLQEPILYAGGQVSEHGRTSPT